ncbi:hypothetical protein [Rhodopirellula sp. MGV]|uniref:hypothetical protein n=1 Tax=Rhodopirellula sp. MGV TaxID=2023130 RepID=UPI000B96B068|nr:hypothetical protein [Rhodopirellula sp. MGV]OYP34955.1 hypothetical protein CGZ80_13105 [Rhodopirellula sp. MGV]PNY38150.1 hypothetical protein C2E31_03845 [Rhodopirellula baltica]
MSQLATSRRLLDRFAHQIVVVVLTNAAFIVCSAQANESEPSNDPVINELIKQLADDSYATRTIASQKLLELAEADANSALAIETQLAFPNDQNPSLESALNRLRLRQLIVIRRQERLLDQFLTSPTNPEAQPPGWDIFREHAGSDYDARRVFVKILQRDRRFGERLLIAEPPNDRTRSFAATLDGQHLATFDTIRWSMLLVRGCEQTDASQDIRQQQAILAVLRSEGLGPLLIHDSEQRVFTRLLESYLCHTQVNLEDRLCIAMRYGCEQLVETDCRRVLNSVSEPPPRLTVALLAIANQRKEIDHDSTLQLAEWLQHYRSDQRVAYVWRAMHPTRKVLRTEVRDVALAVEIARRGEDPRDFGFGSLQAHPRLGYQPYTLGFETEADRQQAHRSAW